MAIIVSSGRIRTSEDVAFLILERERAARQAAAILEQDRGARRTRQSPRCTVHAHADLNCNRCRRAAVLAITAAESERREFRRLMGAPRRVRP